MKFGLSTVTRGVFSTRESYRAVAVAAERAGFDFLSVSDHVVVHANLKSKYPYTASGVFSAAEEGYCLDLLATIAFLSGCTERLRLLASVMVVPHRPAMLTAKMLATIDVLSNGRLILGAGAGWMKEEFALLNAPFEERGKVTDEYLAAFQELWTKEAPAFAGKHVSFADVLFYPKPVQKPHPPVWIGGESPPALRRVAKLGTGWYPIGTNPQHPLDTLARLRAGIERMRKLVAEAGRNPAEVTMAYRVQRYGSAIEPRTAEGERRLFSGSPAEIAADLRALRELGVAAIDFGFGAPTVEATLDNMKRFREQVTAHL